MVEDVEVDKVEHMEGVWQRKWMVEDLEGLLEEFGEGRGGSQCY